MFKLIVIHYIEDGLFYGEEKDSDTFVSALNYAVKQNLPYLIYRNYNYISAVELIARSAVNF